MKKFTLGFVLFFAIAVFVGGGQVHAQTTSTEVSSSYQVTVKPVSFFERIKLVFTFDAEKKAQVLQDFSSRNFALANLKLEEGKTEEAGKLFLKSDNYISKASVATSKIRNEEKQKAIQNNISVTTSNRIEALTEAKARIENPVAKEALDRAIIRQQVSINASITQDGSANQNAGTRGGNGTALGGGIGISAVNSACTPTTTPYVKVLSPNGGEEYVAGQQVTVTWESCNVPNYIGVIINQSNQSNWHQGNPIILASGAPGGPTINDGTETFIIPSSVMPGNYHIWIRYEYDDFTGGAYEDRSDNFFKIGQGQSGISSNNNILSGGQFSCPGISISSPLSNTQIAFPLTVQGVIHPVANPGPWGVFEGEAGHVVVKDGNGNIKSNAVILALSGEWMNTNPKPFSVIIPSLTESPYSSEVFLHFSDNNPMDGAIPRVCDVPVSVVL